ncbi:hypothetical protein EUTSA_v10011888mg [Eutrema salsugineum]|uniref:Knottin scorpion toxin-like domain-containing protein n=1 Tax=Eutrema salsugineum TaxID=72664 RepID=V4KK54_EUTSA|nr:hypothetical protein EUTSA_v10011888mg [Eutrema salsugineum]
MSKLFQLSLTILTIFTLLTIGMMVKETKGQRKCSEILNNTTPSCTYYRNKKGVDVTTCHPGNCALSLCKSACGRKHAFGIGTCPTEKGKETECLCTYNCL